MRVQHKDHHGEEKITVFALMRKAILKENTEEAMQIKSAVCVEGLKGYIYIEAYKQSHVKAVCMGFHRYIREIVVF